MNLCPNKYGLHIRTAFTMVSISFAYVDQDFFETLRARLIKTMGFPFCYNTSLMPSPEAFILMMKVSLKSSIVSVGVLVMTCFNLKNAFSTSLFYSNCCFLSRLARGRTSKPYPCKNLR